MSKNVKGSATRNIGFEVGKRTDKPGFVAMLDAQAKAVKFQDILYVLSLDILYS